MTRNHTQRVLIMLAFVVAFPTIILVAFFPMRGQLPDPELAIVAGNQVLKERIYSRCDTVGEVKFMNYRTESYFGRLPYQQTYAIKYRLDVNGNQGRATVQSWGRSNWFRTLFLDGRTKPISDIVGYELKCGD